ncbi:MAG: polysaccharide deacetylase family protein [Ignavibacteriaceae bacterium]|nr:polysaccharide deacetylase family protein [Ignavibacteriaceae bacterium]
MAVKKSENSNKEQSKQKRLKSQKRGGASQLLIIVLGLLFVAGAVLIYFYILRGVYGRVGADELLPDSKVVRNAVYGETAKIGILYSQYTENMLEPGSTWLNDNITSWRQFLGTAKLNYDIITDSTIELGQHFNYNLLIMPGSRSLSDREMIQLKKYIDQGGSLFATSGTGSYSDDGKWRGWEFFKEVYGLRFSKEISNIDITKIHTLRGGLPITANIPTGYPLKVATWDRPIAVEVKDPRTTQVSFWYNYRLEEGLVREGIKKTAGIVYGTYGKGRFVWMGFEINSIIGIQEDYIYFDRLFNNSINWLTYKPVAFVKDWPSSYDAAAVLAPSIGDNAGNLNNLLSVLKSENVGATFFVSPEKAKMNSALIKTAAGYGDIAALVDVGYLASINDTINKLDEYELQKEKLSSAKKDIEAITNKKVVGCLPYYGLFDQNTLKALAESGYKYVVTDSLTDRSVPRPIIRGDKRLISITKTARDDYEVIRDFGLTLPEFQLYTYQEDVDRLLFEGGLYVFKMHTEYQCKPENVGVVKELIRDMKRKKIWVTTFAEVEKWYARKNYVELRVEQRSDRRIVVTVSNPGVENINGMIVDINLNVSAKNLALSTELIGTKPAKYEYNNETNIIYLFLDDLKPGESRTYFIDYDRPST